MDEILKSRLEENNSYIFIDSPEKVAEKMELFLSFRPDLAKLYFVDTENHTDKYENNIPSDHGLSKDVAKEIVRYLEKKQLPIYAHIETAFDFEIGVELGVDYFAHMPGYGWSGEKESQDRYIAAKNLIRKAVDLDIGIIPTIKAGLSIDLKDSLNKVEYLKQFLREYSDLGGRILIGADTFNDTMLPEFYAIASLEVFSNLELIRMLTYTTPKAIFPERKIGELDDGFEASFLAFENNPLENLETLKSVRLSVKQGYILFSN